MTFSFNFCKGPSLFNECVWWRLTEAETQGRKCQVNNDIKRFRLLGVKSIFILIDHNKYNNCQLKYHSKRTQGCKAVSEKLSFSQHLLTGLLSQTKSLYEMVLNHGQTNMEIGSHFVRTNLHIRA